MKAKSRTVKSKTPYRKAKAAMGHKPKKVYIVKKTKK
jgi:hypothetical protein